MSLKWQRLDNYCGQSGDYIVSRFWTADGWKWEAWWRKERLGTFETKDAAKKSAEVHADDRAAMDK